MEQTLSELIAGRRPGWTLAQPFYTDPEIFKVDIEKVFKRYWLFIGHTSQIPNPGDYFLYSLAEESIIVIRGIDGQIRALYNVCRHRGSAICTEPYGNAKTLVCPYHQWVFDTNGNLVKARLMPDDFDMTPFSLHPAHIRVVSGLIFLSLSDNPPDFDPVERDIRPYLEVQGFETAKICYSQRYNVHANWKLIVENSRECYHCPGGHPEYCAVMPFANLDQVAKRSEYEKLRKLEEQQKEKWLAFGIPHHQVDFQPDTFHHCIRFTLRENFLTQSLDGQPVAPLMGNLTEYVAGVMAIVTMPNLLLEASSDYVMTLCFTPVLPTVTRVDVTWYVREDAQEGIDYNLERVTAVWKATAEQDWKLCEDNQAGVNSSHYYPGPYAPAEDQVELFIKWYLNQLVV